MIVKICLVPILAMIQERACFLYEKSPGHVAGASVKLNVRIEFIAYTVNASDVIRSFWRNPKLVPEIADMVIDCPARVVVKVFVPYQVRYHIVGEHTVWIHDEQGKDVKLFCCQ